MSEYFPEDHINNTLLNDQLYAIYIRQSRYDEARKLLEQAVEVIKKTEGRKSIEFVTALRSLGELYSINGKYDEAKKAIEQSYRLSRKVSDQAVEVPEINSVEEMADLYITTGYYEGAQEILQESIKARTKKFGDNTYQLIRPYQLLGEVYLLKGDFIEAEKNAKKQVKNKYPEPIFWGSFVMIGMN